MLCCGPDLTPQGSTATACLGTWPARSPACGRRLRRPSDGSPRSPKRAGSRAACRARATPARAQHQGESPAAAVGALLTASRYEAASRALVLLATAAYVADVVRALLASSQTAGLAWVQQLSTLASFWILSSVFISDREGQGIACYVAGVAGSTAVLAASYARGAVPAAVFWPAMLLVASSAAINAARLARRLECSSLGREVWESWHDFTGCVGWALLPQVAWLTIGQPEHVSWAPAAISGAAGVALLALTRAGLLPASVRSLWDVPAWTATLLFMSEPLAALADLARNPGSVLQLVPGDFLLPALATGLQVPRALEVQNHMWFTGTSWSTAFAVLQAAVVAAARGDHWLAASALLLLVLFYALLLKSLALAKGLPSPGAALRPIFEAYQVQLRPFGELRGSACSPARGRVS